MQESSITWEGVKVPLQLTAHGWRARKRSRHLTINFSTNVHSLKAAQAAVKRHLEARKADGKKPKGRKTLADVVNAYKRLPKKAGEAAEKISIYRLRSVVRVVLRKELDDVLATAIDAKFWLGYIAKKQKRSVADLGARDLANAGINSAIRTAAAIFKPALRPLYAELGIVFQPDVTTIQWLPKLKVPRAKAQTEGLQRAWIALKTTNEAMWRTIGLARFAGLRRKEAMHCAKSWVEVDGSATYIRLCDRPEEGFRTKTGENYRALVIDQEVADMLRSAGEGLIVQTPSGIDRSQWFARKPQEWVKPFTKPAKMPLHRLRGLYLDDVAKLTEDAVKAKLAGERAAAAAAGHTSTKTTKESYLS